MHQLDNKLCWAVWLAVSRVLCDCASKMGQPSDDSSSELDFGQVHRKIKLYGITAEQLSQLDSVNKLVNVRKHRPRVWGKVKKYLFWFSAVSTCLLSVLFGSMAIGWPVSQEKIVQTYFDWVIGAEMERSPCLVEYWDSLFDFVRPPADCGFCRGISSEHRLTNVSPEEFENVYAYSGQPAVILDATKNWTALKMFNFNFFKEIYSEDSPALRGTAESCQFFPYKTDFDNLGEVFNMSQERAAMKDGSKPWYIGWSNCDSTAANILRQHYTRPYFLPSAAESSKTDWIFMGVPGYGAHMHVDNVGLPSWQAQITGTKIWTLEPPPECYHECVAKMEVKVKPGEIIVLDTNKWFHGTLISGDDMSITIGSEYD